MTKLFLSISLLVTSLTVTAQQAISLSLDEAIAYALEHNYNIMNAKTDIQIAKKRVAETRSIGLPQVNASVSYNNYLELPTQLIPAEFFGGQPGEFAEIQFGTQHNATWGGTVSQLIFNGSYIVGLQAANAYVNLSRENLAKQEIEVKAAVKNAYYPVIILRENIGLLDTTLSNLRILLFETEQLFETGFVEDVDVDQIGLMISNLEATYTNMNNTLEIMQDNLKLQLGINEETPLLLTDELRDFMDDVNNNILNNQTFNYAQHIDYRLLENQKTMTMLDIRNKKASYLPVISAFYSYQENAQRNDFNFFDPDENWFPTQLIGVQLDIPIFSSWGRNSKIQQAKLNLDKLMVTGEQMKTGINMKVNAARSDFENAWLIYNNKKKSLSISSKIYEKTQIKYKEGISSSLELTQTFNQFMNAEMEYLNAMLELLNKKALLEKELEN